MYEDTGELPAALAAKPVIDPIWAYPYSVWVELSGSRHYVGDNPAQIALSEVVAYGMINGFTRSELADLWYDVHRLDKIWQSEVAKIAKDQAPK